MDKAEAFHKECLKLISNLDSSNNTLQSQIEQFKKKNSQPNPSLIESITGSLNLNRNRLRAISTHVPQPTGRYLKMIIGPISLSLPTSEMKFKYKNSYENMKLVQSIVCICTSIFLFFFKI
ncbi:MAG: hypothetical protein MHPSP_001984, partial [Paramarteilia canceri]